MQNWGFWAVAAALALAVALLLMLRPAQGRSAGATTAPALQGLPRPAGRGGPRPCARRAVARPRPSGCRPKCRAACWMPTAPARSAPAAAARRQPGHGCAAGAGRGLCRPSLGYLLAWCAGLSRPAAAGPPCHGRETYRNRPAQAAAEARHAAEPRAAGRCRIPRSDDETARRRGRTAPMTRHGLDLLASNEAELGNYRPRGRRCEHLVGLKGDQAARPNICAGRDHDRGGRRLCLARGRGAADARAAARSRQPAGALFLRPDVRPDGRPDRAFALWEPLLREGPADAPWIEPIRARSAAAGRGGRDQIPAAAPMSAGNGPDAGDVAAAGEMTGRRPAGDDRGHGRPAGNPADQRRRLARGMGETDQRAVRAGRCRPRQGRPCRRECRLCRRCRRPWPPSPPRPMRAGVAP